MLKQFKAVLKKQLPWIKNHSEVQKTLSTVFPILTEIVKSGGCENLTPEDQKWIESACEKIIGRQHGFNSVCYIIKNYDWKMRGALLSKIASNVLQLKFSMKENESDCMVSIFYFLQK